MAFRKVIVSDRCKLEYSLNCLVCRKTDSQHKVLLDEIKLLIINSPQVSFTSALMIELMKRKIKVLFMDEKHNPEGELVPYQNNYYSYRKIKEQLAIDETIKNNLWSYIIREKILNQAKNLRFNDYLKEEAMLLDYADNIEAGDSSNREGHSAKVYFNALFGMEFSRRDDNTINKYLNYGYAIVLSSINRQIKALGYLTELGIHHIGESNSFNLSYDLMEPLRPLVDSYVLKGLIDESNFKRAFVDMLSQMVIYNERSIYLDNAIDLYVEDMMLYLKTGDLSKIRFIEYEL